MGGRANEATRSSSIFHYHHLFLLLHLLLACRLWLPLPLLSNVWFFFCEFSIHRHKMHQWLQKSPEMTSMQSYKLAFRVEFFFLTFAFTLFNFVHQTQVSVSATEKCITSHRNAIQSVCRHILDINRICIGVKEVFFFSLISIHLFSITSFPALRVERSWSPAVNG